MFKNFNEYKCCCHRARKVEPCDCGFSNQQNSDCNLEPFFCPRLRNYVLRGPRGFTGPRGPQGLPGVSPITSFANLINPNLQTIGVNENVVFSENLVLHGDAIAHTEESDVILLIPGAYFVSWQLGYTIPQTQAIFELVLNNQIEKVSSTRLSENNVWGASQIVLVNNNSNLVIQNFSSADVGVENANITILKIA